MDERCLVSQKPVAIPQERGVFFFWWYIVIVKKNPWKYLLDALIIRKLLSWLARIKKN